MPIDVVELRDQIQRVYAEVVRDPKKGYHFHTGPDYAAERLGYSRHELAELPSRSPGAASPSPGRVGRTRPMRSRPRV